MGFPQPAEDRADMHVLYIYALSAVLREGLFHFLARLIPTDGGEYICQAKRF